MTIDNRDLIAALKQATLPPPRRLWSRFKMWVVLTAAIWGGMALMLADRIAHMFGFCSGGH